MRTFCAVIFVSVLMVASQGNALTIDDFSSSQSLQLPLGTAVVGGNSAGSMLGGERRITLHDTTGMSSASGEVFGDAFHYTTSGRPFDAPGGAFAFVTWNSGDPAGAGLGGADLTEGGQNDQFVVHITSLSLGSASLSITVRDSAGELSRWLPPPGIDGPGFVIFEFDEVSNVFPTPADLTSIDSINIRITARGEGGTAISLGSFSAVPEPSTFTLVVCGLWLMRRARPSR